MDNLAKKIGRVVLNVVFVVPQRLYNIYSLIVILLDLFGIPYIHITYGIQPPPCFSVCLGHGLMAFHESL
jgi:hypothetical protein